MTAALFVVTAYAIGCGAHPGRPTKAGTQPVAGFTAAADPAVLPIGSIVHIEGLGERLVHDTGGDIHGRRLDVFVGTCAEAREWGRREIRVEVRHVPAKNRQVLTAARRRVTMAQQTGE